MIMEKKCLVIMFLAGFICFLLGGITNYLCHEKMKSEEIEIVMPKDRDKHCFPEGINK